MTVSISDMEVPATKKELLKQAENTVEVISQKYRRGLLTEEERYKSVVETWKIADDQITHDLLSGLDELITST